MLIRTIVSGRKVKHIHVPGYLEHFMAEKQSFWLVARSAKETYSFFIFSAFSEMNISPVLEQKPNEQAMLQRILKNNIIIISFYFILSSDGQTGRPNESLKSPRPLKLLLCRGHSIK